MIARAKATRELLYVFKAVSLKWSMKRSASWKYWCVSGFRTDAQGRQPSSK